MRGIEYEARITHSLRSKDDKENAIINILCRFSDAKTALVFCGPEPMVNHMTSINLHRQIEISLVALSECQSRTENTRPHLFAVDELEYVLRLMLLHGNLSIKIFKTCSLLVLSMRMTFPKNQDRCFIAAEGQIAMRGKKGTSVLVVPYQRRRFIERLSTTCPHVVERAR